jgi:hypothetical protein
VVRILAIGSQPTFDIGTRFESGGLACKIVIRPYE